MDSGSFLTCMSCSECPPVWYSALKTWATMASWTLSSIISDREDVGWAQDPCLHGGLKTGSGRWSRKPQCSPIPSAQESLLFAWSLMSWKNIISDTSSFLIVWGRKSNLVSVTPSWPEVEEVLCYFNDNGNVLFLQRDFYLYFYFPTVNFRSLHYIPLQYPSGIFIWTALHF